MSEFVQMLDGVMIFVRMIEGRLIHDLDEGQMRCDVLTMMTATLHALLKTLEHRAGDERESFAVKAGLGEFKSIIDRLTGRMESLRSEAEA